MGTRRRLTLVLCLLIALFALTGTLVHFRADHDVSVPSLAAGPPKGLAQGDDRRDRPADQGKLPATGEDQVTGIAAGLVAGLVASRPSKPKPHYSGSGSTGGSGNDGGAGGTGGDGSSNDGESSDTLTVTLGSIGLLYPGMMREFEVTVFNPYDFAIKPNKVIVSSLGGTGECTDGYFDFGNHDVDGPLIDAQSSGTVMAAIGLTSSAPEDCQRQNFRIGVRVEAGRP